MLSEKEILALRNRISRYLKEGIIRKDTDKRFVSFFLENSGNSLASAKLLFDVSTERDLQHLLGLPGFNGFFWVINASYYSIFYMAKALLENEGLKMKAESSVHALVFDALVYYFYLAGKLERRLVEDFAEAESEAALLLGKEKARTLIEDYYHEKRKRADFTYEAGLIAMQNKAQTSLGRAKKFNEEIRKILEL